MINFMKRSFIISLGVLMGWAGTAIGSHSVSTYYPTKWSASHHTGLNITWRFSPNFPDTQKRDRVKEAFVVWNSVGQPMQFEQLATASSTYIRDCDTSTAQDYNGIFYISDDGVGGSYGSTLKCYHSGGTMHSFSQWFDSSENWWSDLAQGPFSQDDFKATAVHEAGHATGWGVHYPDSDSVCNNDAAYHSMCNDVFPVPYKQRSLETHDKSAFSGAY